MREGAGEVEPVEVEVGAAAGEEQAVVQVHDDYLQKTTQQHGAGMKAGV